MAFKESHCIATAALLLAVSEVSAVKAQTAGEGGTPQPAVSVSSDADAQSQPIRLDAISVTATRSPIEAFEFPGMVTVIGRDQIELQQPSTAGDILKWVPNVEFTGGPRRTGQSPSIRGFSGPDVAVLLDGARQNFDSGHDGRFFVDPSLLREVEVLRGSASSLYGSGGMGGVIAFRTARAEDFLESGETAGMRVSGGYQSVNREKYGTVTAYGRPVGTMDLLASITRRASGSIELGDGTELDRSDDDIIAGLAKVGFSLGEFHGVEASFQRFNNEAEEPNNGQGLGDDNLVEKDTRADNIRLAYNYRNPDNDLLDLDVLVYHTAFRTDELRLDGNGVGAQGELLQRDVDTLGFRLDNRSRVALSDDVGVTLTYGAEAYRDEQDGSDETAEIVYAPDADAEFAAAFGQAEIRLAEPFGIIPGDLLIIPGLRYDHYRASSTVAADNKDHALSPRIGVSYLPTDWSLLFASYATAFRAPTINELYQTGTHFNMGPTITNRFVANPDLDPQRTRTLEFGAGLDFKDLAQSGGRFQVKATHFRIEGEDFIDLEVNQPIPGVNCVPAIPGDCDGTTRAVNVADAELWGNEVEASYENRRVRVGLGFSTLNGEDEETGEKLGVLTPTQFTVDTAVKVPEFDSVVGWRMLAADDFDKVNDPDEERDGYAVHDFYFAWIPSEGALRGLRLDLGIDNAFDESYETVFTDAKEPGRSFKALVSYSLSW